ncbi:hypothetical protein BDV93DRAFT_448289 [Ceratobasidium sp. AG-I]|nr:hypothetical protein BDV93DRAFT_448289 [Ceratobasidium sp. AG-I]
MPRHHRFIRPRKVETASSKVKRCTASSSSTASASLEIEPTNVVVGNAAVKPTTTKAASTKSAKPETSVKGSATSTDDTPVPTAGTGGISINDKLLAYFPAGVKAGNSKWSTNPAFGNAIALSDDALRVTKVNAKLRHPVVEMQGKKAQKISFAAGAFAYRSQALGGVSFYASGPASQPITNAKVITFSYSVLFEAGFKFNKGGKLPGLYGGTSLSAAAGCSGGNARDDCFSTRMMWRTNGAGELYGYLPPSAKSTNKAAVCSKTNTSCDEGYGWSLGRGSWTWKTGTWQTMAQKVTLNDIGKSNGEVVIYIDGKEVYTAKNIQLRVNKNSVPQGIMVQSFFGGHDATWASPKDQSAYFADYSLAVLETE